jgi:diguanylate cyclase (GGDEF)-like protein
MGSAMARTAFRTTRRDGASHRPSGRRTRWTVVALAVVLAGGAGTVLVARAEAEVQHQTSLRALDAEANNVASTLQLVIEREQDLVVSAGSAIASGARIGAWAASVEAFRRFPELTAMGMARYVPAADLPAYVAAVAAGSVARTGLPGTFVVLPPGPRPYYCFLADYAVSAPGGRAFPPGYDLCAANGARLMASRDSGAVSVDPVRVDGGRDQMSIETPIYAGGGTPPTLAGRRRAFAGWLGTSIEPSLLLRTESLDHHVTVAMRYRHDGRDVVFSVGTPRRHARTVTRELGGGWVAVMTAPVVPASILTRADPRAILVVGLLLNLLLGFLLLVLTSGRTRALRLVAERTGELRHQALHDGLTGLPNRDLIVDRVDRALVRARRQETAIALMFLDLDGFKDVNDTYGHAAGDHLLKAVSARLTATLRESDTVGRLGGDEFVVLVEGDGLDQGPEVVATRILAALSEPLPLDGHDGLTLAMRASIGIVVGLRETAGEMLRDADVALYEAKNRGKNRHVVFATAMQVAVQDRLELEMDLRNALDRDEFALAYQPTYDLRTRTMTGVEALIRWHHPTRGLVMPDTFIPLAEDTALIVPIGRWVLNEACRYAAAWQRRGRPLPVAVNISGRQLDNDVDFVADVRNALVETGLDPASLTLEITETMLMRDADSSARRLRALKALGIRLAIDDFGTGYSSLAYLQQFPVDALKIDRSFMSGIASSREAGALIRTLVQLGKTLGLETLAEGIEDDSQLATLLGLECDSGQGYLFARPLTPEALEMLVETMPALVMR